MKAYSVSFTDDVPGRGRHYKPRQYRTACVIALSATDAGAKAERYCKKYWPKLHVEEIRLEDELVIIETDEDGALA